MTQTLQDFNVAILVMDGFEEVELTDPRDALRAQGARTVIVSARHGDVQGMR
ncbi:DJ-1/PfpI family protein, partial [Achromobacter xylosoxidans]